MKPFFTFGIFCFFFTTVSAQIQITIVPTHVSCFGGNNGGAVANPAGETPPFHFTWSNGQQTAAINQLPMGLYTVTVTDNSGGTASKSINITQPPPLGAILNGQPQICVQAPDGFAYAIPTGGTPPCVYV